MTVAAQDIIDKVRIQIVDPGPTFRWTDDELLGWLSDAQRALVAALPSVSVTAATVTLVPGTRQAIPADGFSLLMVFRNKDGRAVVVVDRELLDRQYPSWHTDNATAIAKFFCKDETDPKSFFVYPPNNGFGKVELSYAKMPDALTALTDTIEVDDIYQTPLIDYVCYRAHQKDSDFAAGQGVAESYLKAFAAFLEAQKVV